MPCFRLSLREEYRITITIIVWLSYQWHLDPKIKKPRAKKQKPKCAVLYVLFCAVLLLLVSVFSKIDIGHRSFAFLNKCQQQQQIESKHNRLEHFAAYRHGGWRLKCLNWEKRNFINHTNFTTNWNIQQKFQLRFSLLRIRNDRDNWVQCGPQACIHTCGFVVFEILGNPCGQKLTDWLPHFVRNPVNFIQLIFRRSIWNRNELVQSWFQLVEAGWGHNCSWFLSHFCPKSISAYQTI